MPEQACPIDEIKRIILATDGSDFSDGAVSEAISLAKGCDSKIFAVEVVETNEELSSEAPSLIEKREEAARAHLETVEDRAVAENINLQMVIHEGESPFRFIVDEASEQGADIIVMGRRGATGIKRLLMGSVTQQVIGHAPCMVLVAPRASEGRYGRILVATDGSGYSDKAARRATGIALKTGGSLMVLSVATHEADREEAESYVESVGQMASGHEVPVETIVKTGRPYQVIADTAAEKDADLIVIGNHGHTALHDLIMGSTTERVIGLAACPVLVAK